MDRACCLAKRQRLKSRKGKRVLPSLRRGPDLRLAPGPCVALLGLPEEFLVTFAIYSYNIWARQLYTSSKHAFKSAGQNHGFRTQLLLHYSHQTTCNTKLCPVTNASRASWLEYPSGKQGNHIGDKSAGNRPRFSYALSRKWNHFS